MVRRRRRSWARRTESTRSQQRAAVSAVSSDLSTRLSGSRELTADRRCVICEKPLDGSEPYWCVSYPKAAHTRCIDWSERPFPFRRQLELLRRVWRETRHARARREVARTGAWLAALERRWAIGDGNARDIDEARQRLLGLGRYAGRAGVDPRIKELLS